MRHFLRKVNLNYLIFLLVLVISLQSYTQNPGYPLGEEYNGSMLIYQTKDSYHILKLNFSILYGLSNVAVSEAAIPERIYINNYNHYIRNGDEFIVLDNLYMTDFFPLIGSRNLQICLSPDIQLSKRIHVLIDFGLFLGEYQYSYLFRDEEVRDFSFEGNSRYEWNSIISSFLLKYNVLDKYYYDIFVYSGGYIESVQRTRANLPTLTSFPDYSFWPKMDKYSDKLFYGVEIGAGSEVFMFGKKFAATLIYRRGFKQLLTIPGVVEQNNIFNKFSNECLLIKISL